MSQSNLLAIGQLLAIKIQTSKYKRFKIYIILFLMIIQKDKKEVTKLIIFFKKLFDLVSK
jgi:hypothetical protein